MRREVDVQAEWNRLWDLAWYARHMLGSEGHPEADHPGIPKQREVEAAEPELTAAEFWRDPETVARLDGQRAALMWVLERNSEDKHLDPEGHSADGFYDT